MKRVDFSFHNDSEDNQRPAVQRVTFTSPIDLVGKARITRFKVSQGVFPLCLIPPSPYTFNDEQKTAIDLFGRTPLDLYFAAGRTYGDRTYAPAIPHSYQMTGREGQRVRITMPVVNSVYDCDAFVLHYFYSYETPVWKKTSNGWKLANKPMFLYSFNDFNDTTKFDRQIITYTTTDSNALPQIEIRQEGGNARINLLCAGVVPNSWNWQSVPYLLLSKTLMELFGYPLDHSITSTLDYMPITEDTQFYFAYFDIHYNTQLQTFIAKGTNNGAFTYDFSCYYLFELPQDISNMFPYTAILVVIDEFNNPGEKIVVNAPFSSGVVNMSTLSISKLFVVGHSNSERSDFVYVDDSLNQLPLDINLPHQTSLTIRLFFLLKDNVLEQVCIPSNENFFLQITVTDK